MNLFLFFTFGHIHIVVGVGRIQWNRGILKLIAKNSAVRQVNHEYAIPRKSNIKKSTEAINEEKKKELENLTWSTSCGVDHSFDLR